jgi:hypothetical protein
MLSGEAFTVVGVMPPGLQHVGGDYRSMPHGETVDFWWPVTLKQGMRPAFIGVALGLLGAFALTRFMSSLLFGVGATDLETFAVSALLLTAVALVPCWLPARRAAKVDPNEALRYE